MKLFQPIQYVERPRPRLFSQHSNNIFADYVLISTPSACLLTFIEDKEGAVKVTELRYIENNGRYAIFCPRSGAYVDRVYVYRGQIVSSFTVLRRLDLAGPEARRRVVRARLDGSDGRGPARGANRTALLDELKALESEGSKDHLRYIKEAQRRAKRLRAREKRGHIRTSDPLGTPVGLARGQGAFITPTYPLEIEHFEAAILRRKPPSGTPGRHPHSFDLQGVTRGVWEDHPRLDLRVLAKEGYCLPGERRHGVLDWSGSTSLIDGLRFVIDLTDGNRPHAELQMMKEGVPSYQTVELVDRGINGRARWCFVCPVTNKPAEVLALREGRFASRAAQRLVNRSQLRSPAAPDQPQGSIS